MAKKRQSSPSTDEVQLLSDHLTEVIDDSDLQEGLEEKNVRATVENLVRVAMSSLEGFAPSAAKQLLSFWQAYPSHWRWAIDDYYARQGVKDVPQIAQRFLRLSPVLVGRVPSDEVGVYLREATQTFIHGFFQASTALSRAALEAGINECLRLKFGSVPNVDLVAKIDQLERFKAIRADVAREAHMVRKAGGTVLHRSPAPEKLAYQTLLKARRILMELYRS
jgi:hypothetical protein